MDYRKIPKILSPGAYISQTPFLRGLLLERFILGGAYAEGNLLYKIGWAYAWKEICIPRPRSIAAGKLCQLGFTDTHREDVGLCKTQASKLKTQPQITFLKT